MATKQKRPRKTGLTIGLEGFAKISAVEGIHLNDEAKKMFKEFERLGLSPEERRRRIVARYAAPQKVKRGRSE